jgi:hypothetical protein
VTHETPGCCTPKELAPHQHVHAFVDAVAHNPFNLPPTPVNPDGTVPHPEYIALLRRSYWRPGQQLRVAFLGGSDAINARVLSHMQAWATPGVPVPAFVGVRIDEPSDIRVGYDRVGEYSSYIGTDCRLIAASRPTMMLGGFDRYDQPESEWRRVVRHETGHALGAVHEQLRPEIVGRLDPEKVYEWAARTQGWGREMAYEQMLKPLNMGTVDATAVEETSVMCYFFSGDLTVDGRPIVGGSDITARDRQGMAKAYGGSVGPVDPPSPPPTPGTWPLLVGGPRVSGPTPLRLLVDNPTRRRLTLYADVYAGGRAPRVTVGSEGPGEATPIPLLLRHVKGALPWATTDPWAPGRFVVTVAHPDGTAGARAYARLAPAGAS